MIPPSGYTEQEAIDIIWSVSRRLSHKFKFGYLDGDDLAQQGFIFGMDGLKKYDPQIGPLVNFMSRHIHNRLFNFKRDNYVRLVKPCDSCPLNAYIKNEDKCTAYDSKMECEPYYKWFNKNASKRNIIDTLGIDQTCDIVESNMHSEDDPVFNVDLNNMQNIIDRELPANLREDYTRYKYGVKLSTARLQRVREALIEILKDYVDGAD